LVEFSSGVEFVVDKKIVVTLSIVFLILVGAISVYSEEGVGEEPIEEIPQNPVQVIEKCTNVTIITYENAVGTCLSTTTTCDNTTETPTCEVVPRDYECITRNPVETSINECYITGYIIENHQFETNDYECDYQIDGLTTVLICDSKFDGNGDGICKSGETCLKYEITSDSVQTYEKNSQDEFNEYDPSFYRDTISVEAVQ